LVVIDHNFRGNFGIHTDQLPTVVSGRSPVQRSHGIRWPGYPYLNRLLYTNETGNVDEGDGLNGLKSTGVHQSLFKKNVPYWDVIDHVAFDPKFSPFISTTPEKDKLLIQAMGYVTASRKPLYIVTINAEQLG